MNNDETNDEEVVTTWGFVIHGEVVPVTVTDVYAMLGHEPREFYSAEVTYRDETYRVDCRAWTDANEPMGPVMWLLRDLIERRVPVTEVLMPGQVPRAELEARNADLSRDRDTALAAALDLAADRDALRAILEGRTTPPTDAEIDAHAATGGAWLVAIAITDGALPALVVADHHAARRYARQDPKAEWTATRWIAVGADRRPTTWPVVEVPRGA